jgi:tetratricopeptide (TPR) repeat protein
MDTCPTSATLEQLLAGGLPPASAGRLEEHVAGCAQCQATLAGLADDSGLREWLPADGMPPPPQSEPALARALGRLHSTPETLTGPPASSGPLPALGPARQDGDLGCLGPYPVETELGRGGMGIVFRGRDEALRRAVAVKVLRPELADARARARFVREAQAMARVRHDHVVGVYAVADPPDGPPYFTMEYLAGPSLAARLRAHRPLEPHEAAGLAAQVADGLAAAHAAGLVHRDIKPANVLLDPDTGRAKIADFGLARLAEAPAGLTREGVLVGTPAYMSPEQARGEEPDARTDVYSLGVTLYEMLTGDVPFHGALHMVLRQVAEDEPRPPRRLNDAVPRDLETVCLKAMTKEPARRYPTAGDLADDLRRFLKGEPVKARPAGRAERLWRWCRREPVRASLLAALLMALAGALVQWGRAERNAIEARHQQEEAVANLAEADREFARAARAVDTFYGRTYEEGLMGQPVSFEVRMRQLADARAFYAGLSPRRRADPAMRAGEAETCFRLGWLSSQLGDKAEAITWFRQAEPLYEALLAAAPDDPRLARGRAHCAFHLAAAAAECGWLAEAVRAGRQGVGRLEALRRREPDNAEHRSYLAACRTNLARVYLWDDDRAAAVRELDAARPLLEEVAGEGDGIENVRRRVDLVHNYRFRGDAEPDPEAALSWYVKARRTLEPLYAERGATDANVARFLYGAWQDIGRAQVRLGRRDEALVWLTRARDKLAALNPPDRRVAWRFDAFHADACYHLGCLLADLGRTAEALRSLDEARALYEKLPTVGLDERAFQENLARTWQRLGDLQRDRGDPAAARQSWERARAVWDRLLLDDPDNPRLKRGRDELSSRLRAGDAPAPGGGRIP